MKYFNFLNVMCVVWCVCVAVLIHAQITNVIDFKIISLEFIQLAKTLQIKHLKQNSLTLIKGLKNEINNR